jgi:hypothetical protein
MRDVLEEIRRLFEELAQKLAETAGAYPDDPEIAGRLQVAEERAKRGAELAKHAQQDSTRD